LISPRALESRLRGVSIQRFSSTDCVHPWLGTLQYTDSFVRTAFEGKAKSSAPSVAEEAKALSEKNAHWAYGLPSYKGELLTKTVAALTTKEGKTKPSSAPKKTPES